MCRVCSSAASAALKATIVTASLAVKCETAYLTSGSAQRPFFSFSSFLVAPAFCRFPRKLVWFECRDLKQSLRDSAQSAPLCTEAACHLLTSVIRGFILWTLYCGSYSQRHLPFNYIKTQGRGCRENKKRGGVRMEGSDQSSRKLKATPHEAAVISGRRVCVPF